MRKNTPIPQAKSQGTRVSPDTSWCHPGSEGAGPPFSRADGAEPGDFGALRLIRMLGGCPSRSAPQEPCSKTAPSLTGARRYCFRVIADIHNGGAARVRLRRDRLEAKTLAGRFGAARLSGRSGVYEPSCASQGRRAGGRGSAFPPRPDSLRTGRCRCRTDGSCASGADPPTGRCRSGRKIR